MKFLLIANNDSDGVGQVAINLSKNLNLLGHKSTTIVLNKTLKIKNLIKVKRSLPKRIIAHTLNYVKKDFKELFGFGISTINFSHLKKYIEDADVIIIYTFYKTLSNYQLEQILKYPKKIFLRPLDIEMASGGCHFNMYCNKYQQDCDNCHKIKYPFNKLPKLNLLKKKKIINKYKPEVLVQNNYVKKLFDKSSIFKKIKKKVLYIGTNDTRAQLIHKSLARKKLKLNQNEKIILFATFNLSSFIKGGHLLVKALEYLSKDMISKKENITLLTLGKKNQFFLKVKNIKWIHIETTKSNKQLNEIFRASDLMVCPSLFCFGPHIVEEAFLNKLPVVSFDGGSSQDFIVNGKNGYLVKKYNIKKFSEAIKKIISRKQFRFDEILYKQIKENCNSKNEAKKLINFCN